MNQEMKSFVKKTAKIAGVTCVAAGAIALMASGAALKAVTAGGKYLKDTVKKIVDEKPDDTVVEETPAEDGVETPAAEAVADEQDVAESESQEV